jgi:hypothetical protein
MFDVEQKGHFSAGSYRASKRQTTRKKKQPAMLPITVPEDAESVHQLLAARYLGFCNLAAWEATKALWTSDKRSFARGHLDIQRKPGNTSAPDWFRNR